MSETEALAGQIRSIIDRLIARLDGLSEAQLNGTPQLDEANSPYAIAVHVLGNARAWVLGIACGRPIQRDRPAEFASRGRLKELRGLWAQLSAEMERSVVSVTAADLEGRLIPSKELWGEGEPHEVSVREAFLHVIEHASIHLGQLQITLDLLQSEAAP